MRPPCLSVLCIDSVNVEEFRTSQRGNAPKAVRRTPLSSPAPMTSSYRLANFLVLGAAKSGTTWLHEELGRHPDIFMSVVKEPSFFSQGFQLVGDPISYARLFADATDERWVGESSHVTFSHPGAAPAVKAVLDPERFILILRDPVERAHSLYQHMSRHGGEPSPSFEAALKREPARLASPRVRSSNRQYFMNYGYVTSSRYGEQLAHYLDVFERDRFCIVFYEDLVVDAAGTMATIWSSLGVEPIDSVSEQRLNVGDTVAMFGPLNAAVRRATGLLGERNAVQRAAMRRLSRTADRTIDPQTRTLLEDGLRDDVALLERLTGLTAPWDWYRRDGSAVPNR